MNFHPRKLLLIITEAAIESSIVKEIEKLGAHGYTITDVRGKGSRGVRDAGWNENSNIRIEVICDTAIAEAITKHLREMYYENYAMIIALSEVEVLRPEKF